MSSAHAPNLCSLSFDMLHRRPDHGGYDCAYAVNVDFRFCEACGRAPSPPFDEAPYPRLDVLERRGEINCRLGVWPMNALVLCGGQELENWRKRRKGGMEGMFDETVAILEQFLN